MQLGTSIITSADNPTRVDSELKQQLPTRNDTVEGQVQGSVESSRASMGPDKDGSDEEVQAEEVNDTVAELEGEVTVDGELREQDRTFNDHQHQTQDSVDDTQSSTRQPVRRAGSELDDGTC